MIKNTRSKKNIFFMKYNHHIAWIRSVCTRFEKKYYMDRDLYFLFIFFNKLQTLSRLIKIVTHFINFQLSKRKQKEKRKSDSVHSWKNPETHPNLFSKISSFLKDRNTLNLEIYIIECPFLLSQMF